MCLFSYSLKSNSGAGYIRLVAAYIIIPFISTKKIYNFLNYDSLRYG